MKYELAAELKAAGFPQPYDESVGRRGWYYVGDGSYRVTLAAARQMLTGEGLLPVYDSMLTYIPKLDELIGWCRKKFYRLTQVGLDTWVATGYLKEGDTETVSVRGIDAEEAVARLAVLINKP